MTWFEIHFSKLTSVSLSNQKTFLTQAIHDLNIS